MCQVEANYSRTQQRPQLSEKTGRAQASEHQKADANDFDSTWEEG